MECAPPGQLPEAARTPGAARLPEGARVPEVGTVPQREVSAHGVEPSREVCSELALCWAWGGQATGTGWEAEVLPHAGFTRAGGSGWKGRTFVESARGTGLGIDLAAVGRWAGCRAGTQGSMLGEDWRTK